MSRNDGGGYYGPTSLSWSWWRVFVFVRRMMVEKIHFTPVWRGVQTIPRSKWNQQYSAHRVTFVSEFASESLILRHSFSMGSLLQPNQDIYLFIWDSLTIAPIDFLCSRTNQSTPIRTPLPYEFPCASRVSAQFGDEISLSDFFFLSIFLSNESSIRIPRNSLE